MPRKPFKPTPDDYKMVEAMAAYGIPEADMSKIKDQGLCTHQGEGKEMPKI